MLPGVIPEYRSGSNPWVYLGYGSKTTENQKWKIVGYILYWRNVSDKRLLWIFMCQWIEQPRKEGNAFRL